MSIKKEIYDIIDLYNKSKSINILNNFNINKLKESEFLVRETYPGIKSYLYINDFNIYYLINDKVIKSYTFFNEKFIDSLFEGYIYFDDKEDAKLFIITDLLILSSKDKTKESLNNKIILINSILNNKENYNYDEDIDYCKIKIARFFEYKYLLDYRMKYNPTGLIFHPIQPTNILYKYIISRPYVLFSCLSSDTKIKLEKDTLLNINNIIESYITDNKTIILSISRDLEMRS